jgi:acetyltransferase-like isoleucine patch superfamily enzyme
LVRIADAGARVKRLQRWLRRQIREVVIEEFGRVRLIHQDPLRTFLDNRTGIEAQLREAANVVGRDVIVGHGVIIWGGKWPGGVGLELHDRVRIYDGCRLVIDHLTPDSGIVLEADTAMNFGSYIDGSGGVRIGHGTILGPNTVILSSSHRVEMGNSLQESGKDVRRVEIGNNVWIGANVVIRMGITIGARAIVGAGSVVTHDVPASTVVGGNPARVIRTVEPIS